MTTSPRRAALAGPGSRESRPARSLVAGLAAAVLLAGVILCAQTEPERQTAGAQPPGPKQERKIARLSEPWPDADTLASRRLDAESRRLFQTDEPLPFSLKADFKAINEDRDPASTKTHPGILSVQQGGSTLAIPVELRPRGVLRRQPRICDQEPLRIDFPRDERPKLLNTPFEGLKDVKLVLHCRDTDEYEQFVLREYLTYKALTLVTPRSLRARLGRGTYVDQQKGRTLAMRYAFFLETEEDVARRMGGRVAPLAGTRFVDQDRETLILMSLFQFMIGNTDYSLLGPHNLFLVETPSNTLYPVPHDFDVTGIVNPPYAVPDRHLGIQSLTERLYRGPCTTEAELEPLVARFRARKAGILRLFENQKGLTTASVDAVRDFLGDFFSLIDSPGRVKRKLIDTCNKETV
jgi:hypothetical protein